MGLRNQCDDFSHTTPSPSSQQHRQGISGYALDSRLPVSPQGNQYDGFSHTTPSPSSQQHRQCISGYELDSRTPDS